MHVERLSVVRVALYARYSTDQQNRKSIADQLRECTEYAARQENWQIVRTFEDAAISGLTLVQRPGIQALVAAAERQEFDVVLSEALNRISRNLADVATVFQRLRFARVRLVTPADGDVTKLIVGLRGTINETYLDDLVAATIRGMKGRVREGKSGGSLAYGYNVVKQVDERGEPIRGDRVVNEAEAEIVRRIFREFANGVAPHEIARRLNHEGRKSPTGGSWKDSTIRSHPRRGDGILNNEIYIGKLQSLHVLEENGPLEAGD